MDKIDKILAKLTDAEKRELRARIKFKRGPKKGKTPYMTAVRHAAMAVQQLRADWLDAPNKKNVPQKIWKPAIFTEIEKSDVLRRRATEKGSDAVYDAIYFRVFNKPVRVRPSKWSVARDDKKDRS